MREDWGARYGCADCEGSFCPLSFVVCLTRSFEGANRSDNDFASRPLARTTRGVLSGFTIRNGDTHEGGVLGDGTNAMMANSVIAADTSVHDDCEFARRNEVIEGDTTSESRSQEPRRRAKAVRRHTTG